ncbi:3835_t:CDS:10 [Cetraspora pellucida]|uniref:3835_t:CDS:1 n=1 Tax=Cetraspora pellucida TaxID=1433469 RepID=A0A9N9DTL9_9GLOM|nr:3835_t:CDS:10 [Cetraspora pellucida]
MSQNKYLRLEENYSTEEDGFELSEISNKSSDNLDYGLRNRTSTGDLEDNEYLLDDRKRSIDTENLENSPIPMVAAAVSVKDDPSLPCTTFRFWILSTVFTSLGAAVSEFYYFRSNGGGYSIFFVLLVSYIVGRWMASVLPVDEFKFYKWKFTLNPGPFNVKEHVLIAVAAGAGGGSAYGTDIIAIQDLFYNQHPGFLMGILLLLSTQMIGYGLAGFLRKYLVRPANMLWPSNLVFSSLFSTLHGDVSDTQDKLKFFTITFTLMFVWQFVPQFMFPMLTSIALLCLIKPFNNDIVRLGSGYQGLGILNFSLDWNAIGQPGPLYTPWWAQLQFCITMIFDFNTGALNETAYKEYGPVYLSVTFAVGYFYSFIAFTAAITHVILFYGDEIWDRFKASRSEEVEDIHCKMMRNYEEIPNWWYACIFVFMLLTAIILCDVSGSRLPWWGLIIAVGIACIMVLPIGIIQAVSNNQVGLNVITEMICGYIFPGLPIANVYFKCYGYMAMYQCLSFVSDLKLGHYMKIPPKAMFTAQLWGTIVGAFINYWILQLIIYAKRPFLDGTMRDPTGQWTGYRSQVFNTASIVWGLIGPGRTFGDGSIYHPLLWGFLIGFLAPIPFYLLHKKFPNAKFNLVTIPLICNGLSILPGTYTNFIITGLIASFLSQHLAYHRYPKISFPEWWGNNLETQGERCFKSQTP